MNAEEKKDFTEAKKVLNDLKSYAEAKIAKRNQTNGDVPAVAQEINLASQPEVVSDHLEEESVLTPLGMSQEGSNIELKNEEIPVQQVADTAPMQQEVMAPAVGEGATQEEMVASADTSVQSVDNSEVLGINGDMALNSQMTTTPQTPQGSEQQGLDASVEPVPAIDIPSVVETSPTGGMQEDAQQVTATETSKDSSQTPTGELMQSSTEMIQPEGLVENNAVASTGTVENGQEMAAEANMTPQAPEVAPMPIPEPSEIPQIEPIPEISIPTPTPSPENESYQATATGAQATLSEVIPAASDTNVVMPNGTTPQEANDQTLVVGPESFAPTR